MYYFTPKIKVQWAHKRTKKAKILDQKTAVVAERFIAYDPIQVDCHWKTQVLNPLKACIYMVP